MGFEIGIFIILALVYLILIGISIAQYIMYSLSMYTIADKRGIKNAWLSWIPVGEAWVIGKIADEYDERTNTKKNWAKTLLILSLLGSVLFVVAYVAFVAFMIASGFLSEGYFENEAILISVALYLFLLIAALMMIAASILKTICLYKVYESIVPQKAIKYMIVSTIVPLGSGICLLKTRKAFIQQLDAMYAEYYRRMREEQSQNSQVQPTWANNQQFQNPNVQSSLANNQQFKNPDVQSSWTNNQ